MCFLFFFLAYIVTFGNFIILLIHEEILTMLRFINFLFYTVSALFLAAGGVYLTNG